MLSSAIRRHPASSLTRNFSSKHECMKCGKRSLTLHTKMLTQHELRTTTTDGWHPLPGMQRMRRQKPTGSSKGDHILPFSHICEMESSNASKQILTKVTSKWRVTSNWCSNATIHRSISPQEGYCLYVQRPLTLLCREQIPKHFKFSKLAVDDFWGLPTNSKVLLIHYDEKRFHGFVGRARKSRRHQHGILSNDGEIKRKQGDCYMVDCVVTGSDQAPQMTHANNLDLAIFPSMSHRHSSLISEYSNTEALADEI